MGMIYSPPKEIPVPKFDWNDIEGYQAKEQKFINDLREFIRDEDSEEEVGEIIQFPVADGYAQYMVYSLKPVRLIHLPLGDAWYFEYAHTLSAKDIREKIKQNKALKEFFSKKK